MDFKTSTSLEILRLPIIFIRAFYGLGIQRMASQLAFNALFALVPLLALSFQMVVRVPWLNMEAGQWPYLLAKKVMPEGMEHWSVYVVDWLEQLQGFSLVGALLYAFSSVLMVITLSRFINEIWQQRVQKRRVFGIWFTIVLAPSFMAFIAVLMAYIASTGLIEFIGLSAAYAWVAELVIPLLMVILLWIIQVELTSYPVPRLPAVLVSILQTLALIVSAKLFVSIINFFPNMRIMTGVASTLPLVMIWMYWIALVVLSGTLILKLVYFKEQEDV